LLYEGSPMNLAFPGSAAGIGVVWCATVAARTKTASGSGTGTLTSTTPVTVFTGVTVATNGLRNNAGQKLRVGCRISASSTPEKVQLILSIRTQSTGSVTWQASPWVTLGGGSTQWVDFGGFTLDALRTPYNTTLTLDYALSARSSDGTSCSATIDYLETLLYYDFCRLEVLPGLTAGSNQTLRLVTAQNLNGTAWLPQYPPRAYVANSSDIPITPVNIRGTPPRAWSGASLWATWIRGALTLGGHTTTDTAAVTAQHAPMYHTARGNA
jgi:hypothetical protein